MSAVSARAATLHLDLGSFAGFRLLFSFGPGLGFPLEPCGVFAAGLPFGLLCCEARPGRSALAGAGHFDYKPPRTEDDEGVWASAAACMRNYLILRAKVRAFRADPQVAEALRASGVEELRSPTLAPAETWRDVRDARGRRRRARTARHGP
jgi:hypothetical protein